MNAPIGFFDSGVGGTSIWKEVIELLPQENTIYLSDSKNAPYGEKSKEDILALSIKNTELLLQKNAKIIVVACNTATTNTISFLREKYQVPFIGIEPAIKPASLITKTKKIGVLATKGTLHSELFEKTSGSLESDIEIIEQVGEGLVELVEGNKIETKETRDLLHSYIDPMLLKGIDALVLGCTHYPYLIPIIREITQCKIKIIDSGLAVAQQTKNVLHTFDLVSTNNTIGHHEFYINKDKRTLLHLLNHQKNYTITETDF